MVAVDAQASPALGHTHAEPATMSRRHMREPTSKRHTERMEIDVTRAKLDQLLQEGTEHTQLDYKTTVDLKTHHETVEVFKNGVFGCCVRKGVHFIHVEGCSRARVPKPAVRPPR